MSTASFLVAKGTQSLSSWWITVHSYITQRLTDCMLTALPQPAESGSVMFNFVRQGRVVVSGAEDEVFEAAMEAGADDIQPMNDEDGNPTTSYRVSLAVVGFGDC